MKDDALAARPGRFIRWGFVVAALVDAGLSVALHPAARKVSGNAWVLGLAYAAAHVVAVGLAVGALADAGSRWLPPRRWVPPLAAFAAAFAIGFGVFIEDFSVFPAWLRAALTAGAAVPVALLILVRPGVTRSRWLAGGCALAAVLVEGASHVAIDASYPGLHLAGHVLSGLLASFALEGLRLPQPRAGSRWAMSVDGATAAVVAASIVAWPSNAVLVSLARLPTASLIPFLALAHQDAGSGNLNLTDEVQRSWFLPRDEQPPVPPTRPPLFDGAPVVILLTVDALRADVVVSDDDPAAKKATRNLRAMAARGASFRLARSPASSTSPAIASMFTAKYYSSLHWKQAQERRKLKFFLPEEKTVRFPEILQDNGVKTAYVVTATGFEPPLGVARGMEAIARMLPTADEAVPPIIEWLAEIDDRPAFAWAHLLDPHHPYVKGDEDAEPFERYLAEVAGVDKQVGNLLKAIDARGLRGRTYLIVTADHGEAFGEHGTRHHASTIYEELVRIPLVVVGPGIKKRKIDEPVSLIDMGPTVLDLFGQNTPGHFMGQSLVPLLAGKKVELTRPIILDAGRRKQALIGRDGLKAIRNLRQKTTELYDLEADPGETTNLVESRATEARERLDALAAFFAAHELKRDGYKIPYRE